MELIRDVANELDINVLCHKILVNVGILTHADRGSLFLAKGPLEDRYLVAKLFDVTQDTELSVALQRAKNEEIKIPFGVGIAGHVAQTKEIINIKDAYKVCHLVRIVWFWSSLNNAIVFRIRGLTVQLICVLAIKLRLYCRCRFVITRATSSV